MNEVPTSNKGRLIAGLSDRPSLRWVAVDMTGPAREACERLDLSPVAAGALARVLTAAVLLHRMTLKTSSKLILAVSGDGPLTQVLGEVDDAGNIRGTVSNPKVELPLSLSNELGVSRALGDGLLKVWRELPTGRHQSHVVIESGRIGEALTRFLEQSEQTRSAAVLGALAQPAGLTAVGGLMLELLPGASEDGLDALERRLDSLASSSRILAASGIEGLVAEVLGEEYRLIPGGVEIRYACSCSAATIRRYLVGLAPGERAELETENGEVRAECVFCGSSYSFNAESLQARAANGPCR